MVEGTLDILFPMVVDGCETANLTRPIHILSGIRRKKVNAGSKNIFTAEARENRGSAELQLMPRVLSAQPLLSLRLGGE